jgi:hypothetical protein
VNVLVPEGCRMAQHRLTTVQWWNVGLAHVSGSASC